MGKKKYKPSRKQVLNSIDQAREQATERDEKANTWPIYPGDARVPEEVWYYQGKKQKPRGASVPDRDTPMTPAKKKIHNKPRKPNVA